MSRRNKLLKFSELITFPNVYQNFDQKNPELKGQNLQTADLKGKWSSEHFKNDCPLVLELACGRGEYSLGLAERYPEKNFLGVDIKGARIWKGASIALERKLDNVAFLRTRIENISNFFEQGEVDEIWITFPDPFLRESKSNRRLTSPYFLNQFRKILKTGGFVNLKTDSPELYEFTMEVVEEDDKVKVIYQNEDIYSAPLYDPVLEVKTYYEKMHLANKKTIKYVKFTI